MDFCFNIIILLLVLQTSRSEVLKKEEATKIKTNVTEVKKEDASSTLPKPVTVPPIVPLINICDKCTCIEKTIKCSTWDANTTFKDYKWPNTSLETVVFENTTLVSLTQFPSLLIRKLVITGSKIKKIEDKSFIYLKNFTELDLSHNELTSEILSPEAFDGNFSTEALEPLKKLKILNLSYNLFHTLRDTFKHIRDLTVLSLRGNPLKVIDMPTHNALSSIPYLEEIDLSYCGLSALDHYIFHTSHKYLKKIDLSGNKFTTTPPALEYALNIKVLTMDDNPIKLIEQINAFPSLKYLEELNLRNMPNLTRIGNGAFSKLTNLTILRIQNCSHLTSLDENALVSKESKNATWPPLKKLLISDNALQYLSEHFVARWKKLEELDLMNNQWSCDCDNQYLIGSIIPSLGYHFMGDKVNELKCASPPEHFGKKLTSLADRKLRCLDLYNARPEKDAAVLVGILIGLLLVIPVGLALFFFWRRGFFFCGSASPASFSRAFYKRTPHDEL